MKKDKRNTLTASLPAVPPEVEKAVENILRRLLARDANPREFISIGEISARTTLSKPTIWRLQRRGEFPRARLLSKGRYAYVRSEVEAWIRDHAAEENVARAS